MPLPLGSVLGVTLQVTAFAGSEQPNATLDEKLFSAAIDIALVKSAVVPAGTVKLVTPLEATEKSGGPVTMKLNGKDVPPGYASITLSGYTPALSAPGFTYAVKWLESVYPAPTGEPLKYTSTWGVKFVPT